MIKILFMLFITSIPLVTYLNLFLTNMRNNIIQYGCPKWVDVVNCCGLLCLMIVIGVFYTLIFK